MWVLVEWVDQEDDGIDLAFHDPAGDLDIAAVRACGNPLDSEADFVTQQVAGRAGRDQVIF